MLETHTVLQGAQWGGLTLGLEEQEKWWDVYSQGDELLGKGTTDMIPRAGAGTGLEQKGEWIADTKDVGLEPSIHTDMTLTC
jgi:hypothetical protein